MAQVDTAREKISNDGGSLVGLYNENEEVATTSSYVTALDVDSRTIRESVFVIHNNAAGDLDWQILANPRPLGSIVDPTGTDDDDKGWVTLGSGSVASGAAPSVQTLSNPYTRIIVQIKHTTATTNADIWHRGEN
jgi:hypothetical protein